MENQLRLSEFIFNIKNFKWPKWQRKSNLQNGGFEPGPPILLQTTFASGNTASG